MSQTGGNGQASPGGPAPTQEEVTYTDPEQITPPATPGKRKPKASSTRYTSTPLPPIDWSILRRKRDTALEAPTFKNVPAEFAAQNAALGGFIASIPFFGTAYQVAHNVKWINYIYYNQQQFMNWTYVALGGLDKKIQVLTKSLEANTKITLENWIGKLSTSEGTGLDACQRRRRVHDSWGDMLYIYPTCPRQDGGQ